MRASTTALSWNLTRRVLFGCRTTSALEAEIRAAVAANPALSHVSFKRAKLLGGGKIEVVGATS
jgi:hypothetical protein